MWYNKKTNEDYITKYCEFILKKDFIEYYDIITGGGLDGWY